MHKSVSWGSLGSTGALNSMKMVGVPTISPDLWLGIGSFYGSYDPGAINYLSKSMSFNTFLHLANLGKLQLFCFTSVFIHPLKCRNEAV